MSSPNVLYLTTFLQLLYFSSHCASKNSSTVMHSIFSASAVQQSMRFLLAFCVCKKKTFLGLPGSQCWFILAVDLAGSVMAKVAETAACPLSL